VKERVNLEREEFQPTGHCGLHSMHEESARRKPGPEHRLFQIALINSVLPELMRVALETSDTSTAYYFINPTSYALV